MEICGPAYIPDMVLPSGPEMPFHKNQEIPGSPTGGYMEEGKYDGGKYRDPPGHRLDKVVLGNHPELLPACQVTPTNSHKGGDEKSHPKGKTSTCSNLQRVNQF